MTEIAKEAAQQAAARFFIGIAAKCDRRWHDENTLPLFPLTMIMDAEGLLSSEARHLVSSELTTEARA